MSDDVTLNDVMHLRERVALLEMEVEWLRADLAASRRAVDLMRADAARPRA